MSRSAGCGPVPLCAERYCLLTVAGNPLGDRDRVTWSDVAHIPLCLLTPDMQNRRIVEALMREAGGAPVTTLESNSVILLYDHVRAGHWATILPEAGRDARGGGARPGDTDLRTRGGA